MRIGFVLVEYRSQSFELTLVFVWHGWVFRGGVNLRSSLKCFVRRNGFADPLRMKEFCCSGVREAVPMRCSVFHLLIRTKKRPHRLCGRFVKGAQLSLRDLTASINASLYAG